MTTTTFDTLSYSKKLEVAGFTRQQAEVQAEAMWEIIEDKLATKQDIKELEYRLKSELPKWIIGLVVAQTVVIAAVVKL